MAIDVRSSHEAATCRESVRYARLFISARVLSENIHYRELEAAIAGIVRGTMSTAFGASSSIFIRNEQLKTY